MARNIQDRDVLVRMQKEHSPPGWSRKTITLVLLKDGWVYQKVDLTSAQGSTTSKGWQSLHKREPHLSMDEFVRWAASHGYSKV